MKTLLTIHKELLLKRCQIVVLLFYFILGFNSHAQEVSTYPNDSLIEKARIFTRTSQFDSAEFYFQKSIELHRLSGDSASISFLQAEIAKTWLARRNFTKSIRMSEEVLASKFSSKDAQVIAYQNLGMTSMLQSRDINKALVYNHKALAVTNSMTNPNLVQKITATQPLAFNHHYQRNLDSGAYYFEKLIAYAKQRNPPKPHTVVFHQLNMVDLLHMYAMFPEARKWLDSAKQVIDDLPMTDVDEFNVVASYYNNLAYNYQSTGQTDSALFVNLSEEKVRLESPLVDSVRLARVQSNLSESFYDKGDLNRSWDFAQKAFEIKKKFLHPDNYNMASIYRMLGRHRLNQSYAIHEAQDYFKEALRVTEKNYGENHPYTVIDMRQLAESYEVEQEFQKALALYEEALDIQLQIEGESNVRAAQLYLSMARVSTELKAFDLAQTYFDRYFKISKSASSNMSISDALAELGLGILYSVQQDFDQTLKYLNSALHKTIQIYGPTSQELAIVYNQLSQVHYDQGNFEKALGLTKKAIEVNTYDNSVLNEESILQNLKSKIKFQYMTSHLMKTRLLLEKSLDTNKPEQRREAWENFEATSKLLTEWITEQNNTSDVIALQRFNSTLYGYGMEVLWKQDSLLKETSIEKMWVFSEKSKAIHEKLKERKRSMSELGEIPLKILEEESRLNADINYYKSILTKENKPDSAGRMLFTLLQNKKNFDSRIRDEFPRSFELFSADDQNEVEKITDQIGKDVIIVEYFITENSLYAFLLSTDGIEVHKLNSTLETIQKISLFKETLVNKDQEIYPKAASELYQRIFKPFEHKLKSSQLVIVPHQHLWNVNFDLLLTSSPSSQDAKSYDYLLKKYTISYAHSTALFNQNKSTDSPKNQMLAFAYGEDKERSLSLTNFRDEPKENLPGTAKEVKNLASKLQGDFYYGNDANESKFKEVGSNYAILHLALHGEVDNENPDNSKLFFTQNNELSTDDNMLHTFELYNMNLKADLAVLSACNTGTGKITNGEGIMSLGRAFQYAGVNSVMLSQWEVSDAVAPTIMNSFYTHLREGKNKAEALRLAKMEFLESSNNITSNPYYWGSFFILGDTQPIDFRRGIEWKYWLTGFLLISVLLLARKRIFGRSEV